MSFKVSFGVVLGCRDWPDSFSAPYINLFITLEQLLKR